MKSNSVLEKAKTFYNENIPKLPETISQTFDQNMTSENFYNLALFNPSITLLYNFIFSIFPLRTSGNAII